MTNAENRIPKFSLRIYLSIILLSIPTNLIWAKPLANQINSVSLTAAKSLTGFTSPLASKVIFESPPLTLDKAFTDFLVTSRPLNLRKKERGQKRKKPKKDSKIYFIPVAPMPYRYVPGVGYDYQPMKINPIMLEVSTSKPISTQPFKEKTNTFKLKNQVGPSYQYLPPATTTTSPIKNNKRQNMKDSQIIRIQDPYNANFFNGRPVKLKVAHADPRTTNLTKNTLKSNFYFNKNIIY